MLAPTRDDMRPQSEGGVSLWYIATRAGISDRSENYIVNYVRLLIANESFPAPLPAFRRLVADPRTAARRKDVGRHSRWLRAGVDAWFDGFLPPALASVVDDRQARIDGHLLDQRASELAGACGAVGADGPHPKQAAPA